MKTNKRMQNYRARLRKQGLRPIQIWIPDQRAPGFEDELKRQLQQLDPQDEADALEFIAESADWSES